MRKNLAIVKVSEKGWVVIPKELRKKYGIKPGGKVNVVDMDDHLYVIPVPENPVDALYGMLAGPGPSRTDELLRERAADRDRE